MNLKKSAYWTKIAACDDGIVLRVWSVGVFQRRATAELQYGQHRIHLRAVRMRVSRQRFVI